MDKQIKAYIRSLRRGLAMPKDIKDRCVSDLETTIHARLEQGENWEAVKASLGSPKKAAGELNSQMQEFAYRKSPWRFAFLALSVVCTIWLAWYAGLTMFASLLATQAASLGVIGGADGPTAIFVATTHGIDWDLILVGAFLAAGIAGYVRLCRCKPKD